jgi:hypothetical protein
MTRGDADAAFDAAVKRYHARCEAELKYTTWDRSTVAERGMWAYTIADAILAAVAERDKAWREWLRLRYSDEWIATCGDLPDRQTAPEEAIDNG